MFPNPFRLDPAQGRYSRHGKKANPIVGLQSIITDPARGSTWGPKSYHERTARFLVGAARVGDPTGQSGKKRTIGRIGVVFPSNELAEWKLWVANDDVIDTIP